METEHPPIVKCLGWLEVLTWTELFRFANSGNAADLAELYAREATAYVSEPNTFLSSANVQISSWSVLAGGLPGTPDRGISVERITVRVDIAEAGFKVGSRKGIMANALTLDTPSLVKRYMEPPALYSLLLTRLWYVTHTQLGSKVWRKWKAS